MRPLHRPMFRYGGPIKEGVMSGIREPHAGGGRAALVGNPVFPKTAGREHHFTDYSLKNLNPKKIKDKVIVGGMTKVLPKVGIKPGFLNKPIQGVKNWWARKKPTYRTQPGVVTGGTEGTKAKYLSQTMPPVSKMSKIKAFAKENPWWAYGGTGVGMTSGAIPATVGGIASLAEGIPLQIADLLVKDKYFDQDKWMKENFPDGFIGTGIKKLFGKDKKEDEKKLTADELKIKQLEKLLAAKKEPAVPQKSDAEIRQEQIQKYRDIMDIKGMNKEAAYDSLIAASQAINESGDFKGDLRSGKLINQIIQGASKAFDKPKATKDAIDTLILKGEIEKDIKSSIPTEAERAAAAFGISKEEYKNKLLGKNTPAEYIAQLATKATGGKANSVLVSQGYKSAGIIPKATIKDSIVDEWIEDRDGKTEIDYVKEVISKADGFVPGLYVVGDRAVLFDGTTYKYDY